MLKKSKKILIKSQIEPVYLHINSQALAENESKNDLRMKHNFNKILLCSNPRSQ